MRLLRFLFNPRPTLRCFALLDTQGHCRALRRSTQVPPAPGWVEVLEPRLCWLGQPLPSGARAPAVAVQPGARQALAA